MIMRINLFVGLVWAVCMALMYGLVAIGMICQV